MFTFDASGDGLSYQWYVKTPSSGWTETKFAGTGYDTNTLRMPATAGRDGFQYKCIVRDRYNNSISTNAVTLTVKVEKEQTVLATLTNLDSGGSFNVSDSKAIIEIDNTDYDLMLVYFDMMNSNNSVKAWLSNKPSFDVAYEIESGSNFVWYGGTGTYYIIIESLDGSAIGDFNASFINDSDAIIPEEVCSECYGVDGYHFDNCSHYGENVQDSDED